LLDPGELRQVTLRHSLAILKRDQHRQVADTEAKRLEAGLAQADERPRRQADQMPRRR
jgi:hypothetical protein